MPRMSADEALLQWMLESDPALRWQVERDLTGSPDAVWQATRARVATEGFGAALLARQDADGQWAGGAFFPAGYQGDEEGQPWTATTPTLKILREWGLDAAAVAGTADLLRQNSSWEYDDLPYWDGEVDCCINADTLATGAWLGVDVSANAQWFIDHRLPDGGWNCEWVEGSTRSSIASTLNSLVGILSYEQATGSSDELRAARHGAQEYLLQRRLLYRLSTGEPITGWVTRFAYPFRWFYSALKAVDYFRAASLHDGTPPDPRLADAVEVIRAARTPQGTWVQERRHAGSVWFEVDVAPDEPSPWLTFFATRALQWWDAGTPVAARSRPRALTRATLGTRATSTVERGWM